MRIVKCYCPCWRLLQKMTDNSTVLIHTLDSDSLEGTRSTRMFPSKCYLVKTVATHEMYFVIFIKYCVFKKLSLYWYKGFFLSVKKLLKKGNWFLRVVCCFTCAFVKCSWLSLMINSALVLCLCWGWNPHVSSSL